MAHQRARFVIPPVLLFVVAASGMGCAMSRSYQPATTIGERNITAELQAGATAVPTLKQSGLGFLPNVSFALTGGLSERIDGTVRLGEDGLSIQVKCAFIQNRQRGFTLSVAPLANVLFVGFAAGAGAELPVLLGYRFSEEYELTMGVTSRFAIVELVEGSTHRSWLQGWTLSFHHFASKNTRFSFGAGVFYDALAQQESPLRVQANVALVFYR